MQLGLFSWMIALVAGANAAPTAVSLEDSFAAALKRSETLAQQEEILLQTREHEEQATGSILPTVNGIGSYTLRDASGRPSTTSDPAGQPVVRLNATQPLFRGLREYAALRQTARLTESQEAQLRQAELQLYVDVATSFFTIESYEQDLANLKTETELFDRRIKDIRGRAAIGRSRVGDALSIESAQASLVAQAEQVRSQLSTAREGFAFLTGLPADTPLQAVTAKEKLEPVDYYLSKIESRPDIAAARKRYDSFDEGVTIAKGAHLPSADLSGNYYLYRTGSNEKVNWDITALLTIPLYAGGTVQSKVREAASQARGAELELARLRRQADRDIRALHQTVQYDEAAINALAHAKELAEKNQETQARDYRFGLVTNLDVLQSLVSLQEAERSLDRARYSARLNWVKLRAAIGQGGLTQGGR